MKWVILITSRDSRVIVVVMKYSVSRIRRVKSLTSADNSVQLICLSVGQKVKFIHFFANFEVFKWLYLVQYWSN